jgi:hypothetical protein
MDFAIPTIFVVPAGNTLPTSGSTQDLTPGQFGVYDNAYVPATAGTIASKPYIYLAQGRGVQANQLASKRSDKIYTKNVMEWYKISAEPQVPSQITEFSNFNVKCDEDLTLTFRLMSSYINIGFYNGLTRSVWVKAPCCDCGEDPCETVDAAGIESIVDQFAVQINQEEQLSRFLTAIRVGSGATSVLRVYAKILDKYGQPCEPNSFSFEYDRLSFWSFAHKGPLTTQDYEVPDACEEFATITITQRSLFGRGSSDEIAQLEHNFYSYQTDYKHIFNLPAFNPAYESFVTPGTFYDTYYIKFKEQDDDTFMDVSKQAEQVVIAVPQGQAATIEALLVAFLGAVHDYSPTDITTTTTSSTSSTTTTSTTANTIP